MKKSDYGAPTRRFLPRVPLVFLQRHARRSSSSRGALLLPNARRPSSAALPSPTRPSVAPLLCLLLPVQTLGRVAHSSPASACCRPSPPGFFPERHRPPRRRICCRCIRFARRRIDSAPTRWTSGSSLCCGCLDVARTQVLFVTRVQAPPVARPPFVTQPRAHLLGASICAKMPRPRRHIPGAAAAPSAVNAAELFQSAIPNILEAQTLFAKPPENKKFMFLHCWLKVRHCQKFLEVETNKRPWSRSSTPSEEATEEEGHPVSARPRIEKRPIGRKQAKERLKTGGDAGPYKEAIAELILDKEEKKLRDEEKKLKEERWKEDRKMKEERWNETKMMQQQKISLERERLMWEQEQKIMFCDVSTLDPDQKTYVLAKRAQIAAQQMAAFNSGFGIEFNGGLGASSDGSGGAGSEGT